MTATMARTQEIKRILTKAYPGARFHVRTKGCTLSESIRVCTDIYSAPVWNDKVYAAKMRADRREPLTREDENILEAYRHQTEEADRLRQEIRSLIGKYESVDRDKATGEILLGGNTYLSVEPLA